MVLSEEVLDEIIHTRDMLAHYFFRKQKYRYPLEEYISAGNLGIAEGLFTYEEKAYGTVEAYICMKMKSRMLHVVQLENKLGNKVKLILHPCMKNTGYYRVYLKEIYAFINKKFSKGKVDTFNKWLYEDVPCTNVENVFVHHIRKAIRNFD